MPLHRQSRSPDPARVRHVQRWRSLVWRSTRPRCRWRSKDPKTSKDRTARKDPKIFKSRKDPKIYKDRKKTEISKDRKATKIFKDRKDTKSRKDLQIRKARKARKDPKIFKDRKISSDWTICNDLRICKKLKIARYRMIWKDLKTPTDLTFRKGPRTDSVPRPGFREKASCRITSPAHPVESIRLARPVARGLLRRSLISRSSAASIRRSSI